MRWILFFCFCFFEVGGWWDGWVGFCMGLVVFSLLSVVGVLVDCGGMGWWCCRGRIGIGV